MYIVATHSSLLAWRIPGTVEPSGLPSVGSHRVGHDQSDLAAAAMYIGMHFKINSIYVLQTDHTSPFPALCYTIGSH